MVAPASANKNPADDVDHAHQQRHEAALLFADRQQNGLDVKLEKDARDGVVVDLVRLGRDGVLVGEDRGGARVGWVRFRGARVDGRHDREVVLVSPEVGRRRREGPVQRVLERWVEWSEGKFVDYMGKIESYKTT